MTDEPVTASVPAPSVMVCWMAAPGLSPASPMVKALCCAALTVAEATAAKGLEFLTRSVSKDVTVAPLISTPPSSCSVSVPPPPSMVEPEIKVGSEMYSVSSPSAKIEPLVRLVPSVVSKPAPVTVSDTRTWG